MRIRTVLGDLPGQEMGFTDTHEHVYCKMPEWVKDRTLEIADITKSTQELKLFRQSGGYTIVEGTPPDYGRAHPRALCDMSRESGVHIIASTGFYLHSFHSEEWAGWAVERTAEQFIRDLREGMAGTDIRAGQIKCAVSRFFLHPQEEKGLRAAARAQKATGAPIWIHHGGIMGHEILDVLEEEGADLSAVVLGHCDRNPDPYDYLAFARRGVNVSVDDFPHIGNHPVQCQVDFIKDMADHGYLEKLVLAMDLGRSTYLRSYGGGPGWTYLPDKMAPRLRAQCGFTQHELDLLLVKNPAGIYARF